MPLSFVNNMGRKKTGSPHEEAPDSSISNQNGSSTSSHLASLIDSITTSPGDGLDLALIKSIKQIVRTSDALVCTAFDALLHRLKQNHAQVRYLTLLVADELFTRSKLFRTLLVKDFELFMLHTVGYRSDCPLPPPANRATVLRAKSMEILEKWNDMFGPHYKPLRLGYEYLKNTLHLQFPNLREAAARADQQRKEREERSKVLAQKKYEKLKGDYPALSAEIQSTLNQLDECFEILSSMQAQNASARVDASTSNYEEHTTNSLRRALEEASCQPAILGETQDNKPVFDTIRELCRLIVSKYIPLTQGWMPILMRVDPQDVEVHNSLLRCVIDTRNQLVSAKTRCCEMGVDPGNVGEDMNEDDDLIWEDGGVVNTDVQEIPKSMCSTPKLQTLTSEVGTRSILSDAAANSDGLKRASGQEIDPVRKKLLEDAPVVPWGSYLDRWGAEDVVPVNQRGLLLESHWGKVDFDALLPAEKVAEMTMRASYYTSAQSEIPPCSAPLKNGGLCQRRDLKVCPLHGPVVPRHEHGNPILSPRTCSSASAAGSSKSVELDSKSIVSERVFVKMVAQKAVANIRKKDEEELNKKIEKRLQAKRDREHNAVVLRNAALAQTSQGLGEAIGEDLERLDDPKQKSKKAKASLKAMLQPKCTAKDRLGGRLLSGRANDATIRVLTREQEAAYKEAFANQW